MECTPGRFVNETGRLVCGVCPKGFYADATGSVQCTPCAPGYYAPTPGMKNCTPCLPGSHVGTAASDSCVPCSAGHYADLPAAARCIACGKGSAQPANGSTGCIPCQFGQEAPAEGSITCSPCPPGTVTNNITGFTQCQPCPDGTYNAAVAGTLQVCRLCPSHCRCSPSFGGAGIVADAEYFVSFAPTGLAVISKCASGACLQDSTCASGRIQGSSLCQSCEIDKREWDGQCVRCNETQGGMIFVFLLMCFVFVGILHVLSKRTSKSGHLKILMYVSSSERHAYCVSMVRSSFTHLHIYVVGAS